MTELSSLTATEAATKIASGEISSEDLVKACLEKIDAHEETIGAWIYLDKEHALGQAKRLDEHRASGRELGPLHGVPVAIKDIIDTADMPTQCGTPIHANRQPSDDAALVAGLRQSGAVIMGKTVTTELAVFTPGKTRNPANPEHTPGGSSSGSAAAVAANMVPLAVGSQTAGSILRPASYCGVYGYKPTFGAISRTGVITQSPPLDTIGCFARSIEDLALLTDCMTAYDPQDAAMTPRSRGRLASVATSKAPAQPALAFIGTPPWEKDAEAITKEAYGELVEALGDSCDTTELPEVFDNAWYWQHTLQWADIAKNYGPLLDKAPDQISPKLKEMIEEGRTMKAVNYNIAHECQDILNAGLDEIFVRYDAVLTPATSGPAPKGLDATGLPTFNSLWTYCGVPCLSIPLLEADGMPLGVQLVGPRNDDGRLLRTANWLVEKLTELT